MAKTSNLKRCSYLIASLVIVSAALSPFTANAKSMGKRDARAAYSGTGMTDGRMITGKVSSINGARLTITGSDGKTYDVDAGAAKLISSFGLAGVTLGSVKVGDTVTVVGTVNGSSVAAKSVADSSLLGRDVFIGLVAAVNGSVLTVDSWKKDGKAAYSVDASKASLSRMVDGSVSAIALAEIKAGDLVAAAGTLSGSNVMASSLVDFGRPQGKMAANVHSGTVTAVNGTVITMSSKFGADLSVYAVDVSTAKISKGVGISGTPMAVSDVKVGDRIMVTGSANGSSITASAVRDLGPKTPVESFLGGLRFATVTAISGTTITGTSVFAKSQVTFTIDASSASIAKGFSLNGSTIAISEIKVGDQLIVNGTVNGTNIKATEIRDIGSGNALKAQGTGTGLGIFGRHGAMKMGAGMFRF